LIDLVGEDHIKEIEVERKFLGGRIRIVKTGGDAQVFAPQPETQTAAEAEPVQPNETDGLHPVLSPMVGMFYSAPSPDVPPYVEEGDIVSSGQTLCIIEAMKIMNEIDSDIKGRVARILVESGNPVEYNTPLFLLEPL
jgi:acetyl-CoA carboxylase biotin carboxyl carrier protein